MASDGGTAATLGKPIQSHLVWLMLEKVEDVGEVGGAHVVVRDGYAVIQVEHCMPPAWCYRGQQGTARGQPGAVAIKERRDARSTLPAR